MLVAEPKLLGHDDILPLHGQKGLGVADHQPLPSYTEMGTQYIIEI